MIKNWKEYINEDLDVSDSLIDAKMQEISDLVDSIEQSQSQGESQSGKTLIYEWENKNDHNLIINFTKSGDSIKYEFEIDRLYVKKISDDVIDFETEVSSIDEGLDLIENDIKNILGLNENKNKNNDMNLKYIKEFKNFNKHPENSYDLDPNDDVKLSRKEMENRLVQVSAFADVDLKEMTDSEIEEMYDAMEVDATEDKKEESEIDPKLRN